MGSIYSPRTICVAVASTLSTDSCLGALTWLSRKPGTIGELFDEMPCGIVDFDLAATAVFEQLNQATKITFPPLLVELFVEITDSDAGGTQADNAIWRYWWCLCNALRGNRYLGHTVDGSLIRDGTVEGFPLETKETGLLARYAWVSLEVWRMM